MKKYLHFAFLVMYSSLINTMEFQPMPIHHVSRETFIVCNAAIDFEIKNPNKLSDFTINQNFNLKAIVNELREIDVKTPEAHDFKPCYIKKFMKNNDVIIQYGNQQLTLGKESYLKNQCFTEIPLIKARPSQFAAIINSSFFKSSCAATIAGLGTYFAVGFYNKSKNKNEQLSQKKWALSAAALAGIGTFAYLYCYAQ